MSGRSFLSQVPGFSKYKILLLFVVKVLALFFSFLVLKWIHRNLIDPSSTLWVSHFLRNLNIYSTLSDTIIYPAQIIVNAFGFETVTSDRTLSIVGARGIIIHAPCLGITVMSVFAVLIIAFPSNSTWKKKFLFIALGIAGIHLLNILRVAGLVIKNNYSIELPINHHDLFNIVIYTFVTILSYIWISFKVKASKTENI